MILLLFYVSTRFHDISLLIYFSCFLCFSDIFSSRFISLATASLLPSIEGTDRSRVGKRCKMAGKADGRRQAGSGESSSVFEIDK